MTRYVLAAVLLAAPVVAKDFPVNDQEQQAIAQFCELAAKSPNVDIASTAQIATWCVQWRQRIQAANTPPPAPTPPVPTPK